MMESKKGFSLLEVMVAISILVMGLLAVVTLLLRGAQTTRVVTERAILLTLSEEVVESARERYSSDIIAGNPFEDYQTNPVCSDFGDCILGYPANCINATCDGFDHTVPGCEDPVKQRIMLHTGGLNVRYVSDIGYFQVPGGLPQCSGMGTDTGYSRKVRVTKPDSDSIEVCSSIFGDFSSSYPNICERFTDQLATP